MNLEDKVKFIQNMIDKNPNLKNSIESRDLDSVRKFISKVFVPKGILFEEASLFIEGYKGLPYQSI